MKNKNLKRSTIISDCDAVLLNWITPFRRWMGEKGFAVVDTNQYDLSLSFNVESRVMSGLIREFCHSDEMRNLKAHSQSDVDAVCALNKMGYKIVVMTMVDDDIKIHQNRILNLRDVYGDCFEDIIFTNCRENKRDALSGFFSYDCYFVEDNVRNYDEGIRQGFHTFLMTRPWNRSINTDTRVSSWKEIYKAISADL